MSYIGRSWVGKAALCALVVSLTACALPRSGPNKAEILSGSVDKKGDAYIVNVTDRVTRVTDVIPPLGFSSTFTKAGMIGSDTIRVGDTLGISIWENVDRGILTSAGAPAALNQVQVDGAGYIFIPYAGRIKASGNSPEAIRRIITNKLAEQTPDPQVMVTRDAGNGATVTIAGSAGGQGVFAIQRATRKLSGMLAAAGGVKIAPEIAKITITRGNHTGEIWYQDLFKNPKMDIALRDGDRILVEADTRSYTTLGASGAQQRVKFESQRLSAMDALAQVGGLSNSSADPTGIFVLRDESAKVANTVLGRSDLRGTQRMVYILNLTKTNGMFVARDFMIRDGDTVYVTEAPYVQWTKALSALTGSLATVGSVSNLSK